MLVRDLEDLLVTTTDVASQKVKLTWWELESPQHIISIEPLVMVVMMAALDMTGDYAFM